MARKRLLTGKTLAAIATGGTAAVLGAWGTHFVGPSSEQTPLQVVASHKEPDLQPTSETLLSQSRISFADWQALVKQPLSDHQRKRIFERYRGERVTWQGYVESVNRITPENGATSVSCFTLVLHEDRETLNSRALGRAPALCIFPRDAEGELNNLTRGDRVVLQGTFADPTLHGQLLGTRLYNCTLVDAQ